MATQYPLFFKIDETFVCNDGKVARVLCGGRAVLWDEDDCFWFYGVQPGSVSGGAEQVGAAFQEFKRQYRTIMFDLASETATVGEFQAQALQFFNDVCVATEAEWTEARDRVRAHGETLGPLKRIERDEDWPIGIQFITGEVNASLNPREADHYAAAA